MRFRFVSGIFFLLVAGAFVVHADLTAVVNVLKIMTETKRVMNQHLTECIQSSSGLRMSSLVKDSLMFLLHRVDAMPSINTPLTVLLGTR